MSSTSARRSPRSAPADASNGAVIGFAGDRMIAYGLSEVTPSAIGPTTGRIEHVGITPSTVFTIAGDDQGFRAGGTNTG